MATTSQKPVIASVLLNAMTQNLRWGETSLQYYFGGATALTLDPEFEAAYHAPTFYTGTPDANFKFATTTARGFAGWDAVSSLDFTQTTDTAVADFVVVSSGTHPDDPGMEGFFQFIGSSTAPGGGSWSIGAFSTDLANMNANPETGGGEYRSWTILHEMGHSLGLKHSFASNSPYTPLTGIGQLDNERYTVMSYKSATSGQNTYGHAVTPMALDIAAIQADYASEAYATGDSTYTLTDAGTTALSLTEGNVSIGRAYYCIWDTGGNDKIAYAGNNPVLIDLVSATINTASNTPELTRLVQTLSNTDTLAHLSATLQSEITDPAYNAGGAFSSVLTSTAGTFSRIDGGYSIANTVVIESAVGGGGADILIGNEAANTLSGGAGNDVIIGGGGNDTIDGGAGTDTAWYAGLRTNYVVTKSGAQTTVQRLDTGETDTLTNVETIRFNNTVTHEAAPVPFDTVSGGTIPANDDGSSSLIDISSVFTDGLVFHGQKYTGLYVNNNGNITFGSGLSSYTPSQIGGSSSLPIIAPFWADVDTRSAGSQLVSYGLDTVHGSFVATWAHVDYYNATVTTPTPHVSKYDTFQLELINQGGGDFEIVFRYGPINWVTGDASGGTNGLGGTVARAGISTGDGVNYFELPQSGQQGRMLSLDTTNGNTGVAGLWQFAVTSGNLYGIGTSGADTFTGDSGDNFIDGGAGNDVLHGGGGNDVIVGGPGDDQVFGDEGDDTIVAAHGGGNDYYDGGSGTDTISYESSTLGVTVDLGQHRGQGSEVDTDQIFNIENLIGGSGADTLRGDAGSNVITGKGGNDTINGGDGIDTAAYTGSVAQYTITANGAAFTVTDTTASRDGTDSLTAIEQIRFSDYTLVFDLRSSQDLLVYKLYQAAYARTPDNDGFRFWATLADANGLSASNLANNFLAAPEFTARYGDHPTNTQYVTALYGNVLGRTPDASGLAFWIGQANSGMARDQLLISFALSAENATLIGSHVSNGYWTT